MKQTWRHVSERQGLSRRCWLATMVGNIAHFALARGSLEAVCGQGIYINGRAEGEASCAVCRRAFLTLT